MGAQYFQLPRHRAAAVYLHHLANYDTSLAILGRDTSPECHRGIRMSLLKRRVVNRPLNPCIVTQLSLPDPLIPSTVHACFTRLKQLFFSIFWRLKNHVGVSRCAWWTVIAGLFKHPTTGAMSYTRQYPWKVSETVAILFIVDRAILNFLTGCEHQPPLNILKAPNALQIAPVITHAILSQMAI